MPASKKLRKKTTKKPEKKAPADNVVGFVPSPRGMEGVMSEVLGTRQEDPIDQAQSIMYDAWECAVPKQRVDLAREALRISPLCADAYNLLAEEDAKTQEEVLAYYQKAVKAGEEALGTDGFKEYAGHFWGCIETRPYMRARAGLGEALWAMDRKDVAIQNFQEMLELNPSDNQGIRYVLVAKLLDIGQMDELKLLLDKCSDEFSADIQYTRAFVAYFEDSEDAEELAKLAWETNQYIPGMLSGRTPTTKLNNYITMGGKDEASAYVDTFGAIWIRTSEAIQWLEEMTSFLERK